MKGVPQLKQVFPCICGETHEAIARVAQWPVILCPLAPANVLYFYPGKPFLVTGKPPAGTIGSEEEVPPEPTEEGA